MLTSPTRAPRRARFAKTLNCFDFLIVLAGAFGGAGCIDSQALALRGRRLLWPPSLAARSGWAAVSVLDVIGQIHPLLVVSTDVDWKLVRSFGFRAPRRHDRRPVETWATSRALEIVFGSCWRLPARPR